MAKDVCDALGLNTTTIRRDVDADAVYLCHSQGFPNRGLLAVNESGLYSLILKSRKPEARAFQKWVTGTVLPTVRKTGGYMTPAVAQAAVDDPAVSWRRHW
ncbi:hypothetical protein BH09PSE5_BH09PSE5_06840 [soil metagenome]